MNALPVRLLWLTAALALAAGGCKKDGAKPEADSRARTKASALKAEPQTPGLPSDKVWAASAHIRIVDTLAGTVVAGIDLQKALSGIVFTPDGATAFVASSDGVLQIDAASNRVLGKLTGHPARHIALDDSGTRLQVLEHDVVIEPNGVREILPFRMVVKDVKSGQTISEEEIGHRILYALPSVDGRRSLVITEPGEVLIGGPGDKLSGGRSLDLVQGLDSVSELRVREMVATHGTHAYVPVEGTPSRVLDVDLKTGAVTAISLAEHVSIRGLAVTPDGKRLVVDAVRLCALIDLETTHAVTKSVPLDASHQGVAISADGDWAFLANTVDGNGGAVTIVRLDPLEVRGKIHLDDISPWVIAVRPRVEMAGR